MTAMTGQTARGRGKGRQTEMWQYQKKLQYPINIKQTNPKLAALIISQYGGAECKKI